MKKQVLCLCLPLLLGLVGCSKGDKVESVEEKKAVVNDVTEGVTKHLGFNDFVLDFDFRVDGEFSSEGNKLAFDDFEIEAQGEFDFPDTMEKGADIAGIKAHVGLTTDGDIEYTVGSAVTKVDCDSKFADFFFEEGTFYADIYKNGLSDFLASIMELEAELPIKSKLNLSELIDPNSVIDLQKEFESPEIPEEILSQVQIYVSGDEYTFELDTAEAEFTDEEGVKHNVKEFYGVDVEASFVIDKEFRLQELELEGSVDVNKLDEDHKATGNLAINLDLNLNYKSNPTVKSVSNKEEYKQFKLFSK